MGAAFYRARLELRRHRRATVALALLTGLAGAVVLTTLAGARRSSTAYDRFREETLAADLDIAPSDPDPAKFEELAALPQVEGMTLTVFPFIRPQGTDLYPFLDFLAVAGADDKFGVVIDRPRVLEGRVPDMRRSDEFAIIERFADELDLGVGDRVSFESYAPSQVDALFGAGDPGEPAGPVVTLTVTGIVGAPDFLSESVGSFVPRAVLTTAFSREYGDRMGVYPGSARVRVRGGARAVDDVAASTRRIYRDDPELQIQPASEVGEKIDESLRVVVVGLLLCAACAALAAVVAVGQALARHLSQAAVEQHSLAAVGMDRRERMAALTAAAFPIAVGGALVAVVVAIAASPLMPIGIARRAEPDPGVSVDGLVLGLGAVGIALVVFAVSVLVAWQASRIEPVAASSLVSSRRRPWSLLGALAAAGLPATGTTGVRMALEPGRGRTALPVRSTLVGIVFGVMGLVAVVVFASSVSALVDSPARYGFPWDAVVTDFGGEVIDNHGDELAADPTITEFGTVTSGLVRLGAEELNASAYEPLKGTVEPTLLEGRLPATAGEVVLGSSSMRDADVGLGDSVELTGSEDTARLRVVGRAAFPILDDRSSLDRGAVLTPDGLEPLGIPESAQRLVVSWAAGVDQDAARRDLEELTGAEVVAATLPSDVNNLKLVETVPRALALFLAALAVLALAHTLVTTIRRRRHDLAILRTLGFVGRQVSATVAWQATTFAVVGLLAGVPLGVAAGRAAWSLVADGIGVTDRPAVPLLMLAVIALVALALANLMAAVPARMAQRVRPGADLRAP